MRCKEALLDALARRFGLVFVSFRQYHSLVIFQQCPTQTSGPMFLRLHLTRKWRDGEVWRLPIDRDLTHFALLNRPSAEFFS